MIAPQSLSRQSLLASLQDATTLVTGNARLSASLMAAFDEQQLARGLHAWHSPDILPWTRWIRRLWETATLAGRLPMPALLLSPAQELRVWETVLETEEEASRLLQIPAAARELQQSRQLLRHWRLELDETAFGHNEDSQAFHRWALAFEARCRKSNWLAETDLVEHLQAVVHTGGLPLPDKLLLTGFDELTPQQLHLLTAMEQAGCEVQWLQLAGRQGTVHKLACADSRDETEMLCRWLRQRLEANPAARIGVVVPELGTLREIITHKLDEVLLPASLQPGGSPGPRPWNISLGKPLSEYPLIRLALQLLGMMTGKIAIQGAAELLRSPFLSGWDSEADSRSHIEQQLWQTAELEVSLATLLYQARRREHACSSPVLARGLEAWQALCNEYPARATAGQWAEWFSRLLEAMGWARGRSLSSDEYQSHEAWREVLCTMAQLEQVSRAMTASEALRQLRRLLNERIFQPQSPPAPVQVLGLYESIGLEFDHLWILGLHDEIWPPPPRPSPFIPLPLQKQHDLPHASAERELQVAQTVTRRLLTCAGETVVSFPQRAGDAERRESPLIAGLDEIAVSDLNICTQPVWLQKVHQQGGLTILAEDPAPAVAGNQARGGSSLFKHQSNCPFRAFAEIRLAARARGQAEIGLSAMERGSLIHRVLELVWDTLESSRCLHAMADEELGQLVGKLSHVALTETARHYPQTFTPRFRQLEQQRLTGHVLQWLAIEKQRAPFEVVATEVQQQAVVGGLQISLKIDRIDRLADGRLLVIDYKTGEVKPSQWFGARPEEPQLPLYSTVVDGTLAGVLFGQLKAGKFGFNGVIEEAGIIADLRSFDKIRIRGMTMPDSWPEVLEQWQQTVNRLAEDFLAGNAAVDPVKPPETCQYCELTALCRIKEQSALDEEEHA